MSDETRTGEPTRAESIEQAGIITKDDLQRLIELGVSQLPKTDRNFIALTSERDEAFSDQKTSNTDLRRKYVADNLGIPIEDIHTPDGTKLKTRLVGELLYSLVASAKAQEVDPNLEPVLVATLNQKIRVSREKYQILDQLVGITGESSPDKAQKAHLTALGIPLMPNEDPLPPGGLKVLWNTLESALATKFPPTPGS